MTTKLRANRLQAVIASTLALSLSGIGPGLALGQFAPAVAPAARTADASKSGDGADPSKRQADLKRLGDEIEQSFAKLEQASRSLSRATFDPQGLLEEVGHDPDQLFAWVRSNTRYVPYRGALRGAEGTLMDGTGNALDRSLLLAELLRASGNHVRLVHTTLTDELAQSILANAQSASTPKAAANADHPPAGDPPAKAAAKPASSDDQQAILASLKKSEEVSESLLKEVTSVTAEQSAWVLKLAAPLRDAKSVEQEQSRRTSDAKDHWWVQREDGGKWIDADVTMPDGKPGAAMSPPSGDPVELPGEGAPPLRPQDVHAVQVRVVIEQSDQGKLKESVALDQTIRPFEMAGQSATILHAPLRGPGDINLDQVQDPAETLKKSVAAHTQWMPVLAVGRKYLVDHAFDQTGSLLANPTLDRTNGVGSSLAKGVGGLGGALGGGGGEQKTAGVLTAEFIEYVVHSPGRPDVTLRRPLFDLIGPAARAAKGGQTPPPTDAQLLERNLVLAGRVDLLPVVGRLNADFVADLQIKHLMAAKKPLLAARQSASQAGSAAAAKKAADKSAVSPVADITAELRMPAILYSLQLFRQKASRHGDQLYIDRPNILNSRLSLTIRPDNQVATRKTIDICSNPVAVRPAAGSGDAFALRVEQGVLDTAIEGALLGKNEQVVENTTQLFAKLNQADQARLVRAKETVPAAKASDDAKARLQHSLNEGYVAVVPADAVATAAGNRYGWYRIDPATGDTIGVMDNGLHTMEEQAVVRALGRVQEAAGSSVILGASSMFEAQTLGQFLAVMGLTGTLSPAVLYRATLLFAQVQQYISMLNGR